MAKKNNWTVISMKNDWKQIFSFEEVKWRISVSSVALIQNILIGDATIQRTMKLKHYRIATQPRPQFGVRANGSGATD